MLRKLTFVVQTGMKLNKVRVGELLQRVLGLMCTYRYGPRWC